MTLILVFSKYVNTHTHSNELKFMSQHYDSDLSFITKNNIDNILLIKHFVFEIKESNGYLSYYFSLPYKTSGIVFNFYFWEVIFFWPSAPK